MSRIVWIYWVLEIVSDVKITYHSENIGNVSPVPLRYFKTDYKESK